MSADGAAAQEPIESLLAQARAVWAGTDPVDARPQGLLRSLSRRIEECDGVLRAWLNDPDPAVAAAALTALELGGEDLSFLPRPLQDRQERIEVETGAFLLVTDLGAYARYLRDRSTPRTPADDPMEDRA